MTGEERDACAHSSEAMEQLAGRLDDVLFGPAVPCRREGYLEDSAADRDQSGSPMRLGDAGDPVPGAGPVIDLHLTDGEGSVGETVDRGRTAATSPSREAERSGFTAASDLKTLEGTTPDGAPSPSQDARRRSRVRPCGLVPSINVLGITLGQYLRRLAALSALFSEAKTGSGDSVDHDSDRARRRKGDRSMASQAVLDAEDAPLEAVAAMLRRARFWGTAIGSTASLQAEAVRRSQRRVVCGLR